MGGEDERGAGGVRSFSLDSAEAYAALCGREDRPWIANGALPREPRVWDQAVIVERRRSTKLRTSGRL